MAASYARKEDCAPQIDSYHVRIFRPGAWQRELSKLIKSGPKKNGHRRIDEEILADKVDALRKKFGKVSYLI